MNEYFIMVEKKIMLLQKNLTTTKKLIGWSPKAYFSLFFTTGLTQ